MILFVTHLYKKNPDACGYIHSDHSATAGKYLRRQITNRGEEDVFSVTLLLKEAGLAPD